jgi:hypothetical protein
LKFIEYAIRKSLLAFSNQHAPPHGSRRLPDADMNTGGVQYYLNVGLYNESKSQNFISTFYFFTEE